MRAAIFRRSTQDSGQYLEIGDIPRPTMLPGHSLLRVIACGVCRTDLHIVTGELPALRPGILTYQETNGSPVYLAVDEGVLAKVGIKVLVSVRRAVRGTDLGQLHDAVKRQFLTLNDQERQVREALKKLESTFAGRLAEFSRER
jgi:alternate F1F0 ATPase F1 subunit epsilon